MNYHEIQKLTDLQKAELFLKDLEPNKKEFLLWVEHRNFSGTAEKRMETAKAISPLLTKHVDPKKPIGYCGMCVRNWMGQLQGKYERSLKIVKENGPKAPTPKAETKPTPKKRRKRRTKAEMEAARKENK